MYQCNLVTGKEGMYNITSELKSKIEKNNWNDGILVVYCPHTTASVVISENVDIDVKADILSALGEAFPEKKDYLHYEGNAHAHIRSTISGASVTLIVENKKPVLGQFQGVYFMEFDGPRTRSYYLKFIPSPEN